MDKQEKDKRIAELIAQDWFEIGRATLWEYVDEIFQLTERPLIPTDQRQRHLKAFGIKLTP